MKKAYFNSESGKTSWRYLSDGDLEDKNFHSEGWRDYSRLFKSRNKTLTLLPWEYWNLVQSHLEHTLNKLLR